MRLPPVAFALLLALAAPAAAPAATVGSGPGLVSFQGDPDADHVVVELREDAVILRDAAGEITVTGECTAVDAHTASCPRQRHFAISLEGGDDRLTVDTFGYVAPEWRPPGSPPDVAVQVDGGPGSDRLQGGGLNEYLTGGAGADVVRGGPGTDQLAAGEDADADRLEGEAGRDHLGVGDGPDVADGGDGEDSVHFRSDVAVEVSLDGLANDGQAGQGANVLAVERVIGGTRSDTLVGSTAHEQLSGGSDDDVISGGGGDDHIWGDDGADRIDGGEGSDRIDLHEWEVKLPDHVTCGGSRDQVMAFSADDVIDASCENAFGDPWGIPRCGELACNAVRPPAAATGLRFAARGTLQMRTRRMVLPATCSGARVCLGRLTLEHRRREMARVSLAVRPGAREVRVQIPRYRWRRLPSRGHVVVRASIGDESTVIRLKRRR